MTKTFGKRPPDYKPAPGCICPPQSNLTCENPMCPRKGPVQVLSFDHPLTPSEVEELRRKWNDEYAKWTSFYG